MEHLSTNPVKNLLSGYYKNAAVGVDSINNLLDHVSDRGLRKELTDQRAYYESQKTELTAQMAEHLQHPEEQGTLAKLCSDMTIRLHTMGGISTQEAAKLMVEGTNMGMVQLHQVINHNTNVPDEMKRQGARILKREQAYLDRITPYL